MKVELLTQADRIFSSCGRPVLPPGAGWVEFPYGLGYQKILLAGSADSTEEKIVDTPVPFIFRSFQGFALPRVVDGVFIRLRLPSGRFYESRIISTTGGVNYGSLRTVIDPPLECHPGSKFYVTVDASQGVGVGSDVAVAVLLEGTLRYSVKGPVCDRPVRRGDPWTLEPRYRRDPNQNILAPEWRLGNQCYPETPNGFRDLMYHYATPLDTLPQIPIDGTVLPPASVVIESSSDFVVRNMRWVLYPAAGVSGTLYVNLRTDDGYAVTDGFCNAARIGAVTCPELPLKSGGALIQEFMLVDTAGPASSVIPVQTVLSGVRRVHR